MPTKKPVANPFPIRSLSVAQAMSAAIGPTLNVHWNYWVGKHNMGSRRCAVTLGLSRKIVTKFLGNNVLMSHLTPPARGEVLLTAASKVFAYQDGN